MNILLVGAGIIALIVIVTLGIIAVAPYLAMVLVGGGLLCLFLSDEPDNDSGEDRDDHPQLK